MKKEFQFTITEEMGEKRLDVHLAALTGVSRSAIKTNLSHLTLNGKNVKLSRVVKPGEVVYLKLVWPDTDVLPEDIPLDVIYEDTNYIVINKPQGMVVHPAKGHYSGTLVNALMGRYKDLPGGNFRPGIVHRLDKDTSGIILVAKNPESLEYVSGLFRKRKIRKIYKTVLKGKMIPFTIPVSANIGRDPYNRKRMAVLHTGGKTAESVFRVMKHSGNVTLAAVRIKTGRTHQIRVHAAHIGYPVLGDPLYARKDGRFPDCSLALAAVRLSFYDKFSDTYMDFKIKLPARFRTLLTPQLKI